MEVRNVQWEIEYRIGGDVASGHFNPIIPSLFLNLIFPGGGKFAPPWFLRVLGGCGFNFW